MHNTVFRAAETYSEQFDVWFEEKKKKKKTVVLTVLLT